jgi:hypothetical protein
MLMARRASSFVSTFACRASAAVHEGERLAVGVPDDVAAGDRIDVPWRREAAGWVGHNERSGRQPLQQPCDLHRVPVRPACRRPNVTLVECPCDGVQARYAGRP